TPVIRAFMPLEALHSAVRMPMTVASPRAPPALLVTCWTWVPMSLAVSGESVWATWLIWSRPGWGAAATPAQGAPGDDGREQRQQNIERHPGAQQRDLVGLDLLAVPLGNVLPALGRDLLGGGGPPAPVAVSDCPRVGLVVGRRAAAGGRAEPRGAVRPAGPGPPAVAGPGAAGGLAAHHHGGGEHARPQGRPGHPPGQPRPLLWLARHLGHPGPPNSSGPGPRLPPDEQPNQRAVWDAGRHPRRQRPRTCRPSQPASPGPSNGADGGSRPPLLSRACGSVVLTRCA